MNQILRGNYYLLRMASLLLSSCQTEFAYDSLATDLTSQKKIYSENPVYAEDLSHYHLNKVPYRHFDKNGNSHLGKTSSLSRINDKLFEEGTVGYYENNKRNNLPKNYFEKVRSKNKL